MNNNTILNISGLMLSFKANNGFVQVIRGVDIQLNKGEILGILGESGSGKTVTASSVLRLTQDSDFRIDGGSIIFDNTELIKLSEKDMRKIRGKRISYIFQDASVALNPYKRVGKQLREVLKVHGENNDKNKIITAMKKVGIDNAEVVYNMFPWQLSGGLCQRVLITMSTLCSPEIIIADEPTAAIDASLQKKVLDLLKDINIKDESSIIIITHDFDVVRYICNRVVVMYGGLVMEEGTTKDILTNPLHPYTKELINCVESLDNNDKELYSLTGKTPIPDEFKNQCPFYERCKYKNSKCLEGIPKVRNIDDRKVRCILNDTGDIFE
ncbi:ABC transporter ATP-binding protein [Clostridium sp. 'White wine YQ']|uniref:ABC transporter ATP-binding protein n=1 Tax=Clostridium sp. 'White wine YQ' TaxID=3027474 RepID=UPI0023664D3C|nr:ABC transporter ATP-binding protein [Clostridium sp. 'White wine YQ']MDD7795148.1 ABC transporter ATP-binding protein [Clostridium sp. 'White wine YQ']